MYKCYVYQNGAIDKLSVEIIIVGIILCLSSGVLYRYRLMQFSDFLKTNCLQIWESHITANGRASHLVRSNNLRSLPLVYESDNIELNRVPIRETEGVDLPQIELALSNNKIKKEAAYTVFFFEHAMPNP